MREATSGRGRRAVAVLLRILVSALIIVPVSAWSALALWFRLPGPEGLRALAACLFVVLGLGAIAALFLRRGLAGLTVFALVFGALLVWWSTIKPPLDGDWAPDVARQTTGTVKATSSPSPTCATSTGEATTTSPNGGASAPTISPS